MSIKIVHIKSCELHLKQYLEGTLNFKNAFFKKWGKKKKKWENNNDYKGN